MSFCSISHFLLFNFHRSPKLNTSSFILHLVYLDSYIFIYLPLNIFAHTFSSILIWYIFLAIFSFISSFGILHSLAHLFYFRTYLIICLFIWFNFAHIIFEYLIHIYLMSKFSMSSLETLYTKLGKAEIFLVTDKTDEALKVCILSLFL